MQMLLAFLIALAGASWVYSDARSRGINPVPWAILTFLALIIGLPLYLLLRPRGDLTECPRCMKRRLGTLNTCPHCGDHSSEQPEEAVIMPSRKGICVSCGKIIDDDWKYCPYCGTGQKDRMN